MRLLRAICRIIFGLTFILSGFLKFIDPIGNSLIIKEYLSIFHLGFLDFSAVWIGMALSSLEFVIGICILLGIRLRLASAIGLIFISFFTLLTLYLAIFNPISDCGCFGEAIHLTNRETLFKNIILLLCALFLFFQRNRFSPIAPAPFEWSFVCVFELLALFIAIHAFVTMPRIDFTPYKVGTDLKSLHAVDMAQYETIFTYSKDGKTQNFSLDNLPDSTWTFIDSKSELISGNTAQIDLSLSDLSGNDRTDILYNDGPLFAVTIRDMQTIGPRQLKRIASFRDKLHNAGQELYVFAASTDFPEELGTNVYIADYKALLTLNRSNGGAVYFNDGTIVRKWASVNLPSANIAKTLVEDHEVIILQRFISERLFVNISLIGILFIVVLMRYFCRVFYKRESHIIMEKS
ncbi:MAG: DoxX family protein [Bacteroidales bacterium]|nr:DoxX family protein [Bacteroidales bacterium]MDD4670507.1 DoxX family protein [Bacteroidales bacterium]